MFRIGNGFDVHRFAEGRRLVLGGVEIPHAVGLLGHSDADVVLHALCDAMLGALALGDIGKHFPDSDPAYKDSNSLHLLARVNELVRANGYMLSNADIMLQLEKPKIAPYVEAMRVNIAGTLQVDVSAVSVKATTMEQLGFIGREEGAAAYAVVLLRKV